MPRRTVTVRRLDFPDGRYSTIYVIRQPDGTTRILGRRRTQQRKAPANA